MNLIKTLLLMISIPVCLHAFNHDEELTLFFQPVNFTHWGTQSFLSSTFSHPKYGSEFLPYSFSHLKQFLVYGKNNKQSLDYVDSVFRLFNQKSKSSSFINPFAFSELLGELPSLVGYHFTPQSRSFDHLKTNMVHSMYDAFLNRFDAFKEDPQTFFDQLSNDIVRQVKNDYEATESTLTMGDVRSTVIRFIESNLNKLVWSPQDGHSVWFSFKTLANQVTELMNADIVLKIDDVDDLVWSLVHRFAYFIELTGSELPVTCYRHILDDIEHESLAFLTLEEQEACIESKKELLTRVVNAGMAKARAYEAGIISDIVPLPRKRQAVTA